jgi:hypothetical protein
MKAQVKERLDQFVEKHKVLREKDILADAKKVSSPLHDSFTWDNTIAGHKYRMIEARELIQNYTIISTEGERVRAFVYVPSREGFMRTQDVVKDVVLYNEVYKTYSGELLQLVERNRKWEKLAPAAIRPKIVSATNTIQRAAEKIGRLASIPPPV